MTAQDLISRRAFLASTAVGGVVGLAGCAGGDGAGNTTASATATATESPTATTGGGTGSPTGTGSDGATLPTPTLGPSDAEVTVSVYEDFLCGHCAHYNLNGFPEIRSNYVDSGSIRYEHHDFPVVHDTWSWRSAIAARSVQATVGQDAYWTYAKRLFAKRQDTSIELYRSLAGEVDADPDVVERHVLEEEWRPVVEADQERGIEKGVQGTPTFFVNGTEVDPAGHDSWYGAVSEAIDSALD